MFSLNRILILASILSLSCSTNAWSFSLPTQVPTMNMMSNAAEQAGCVINSASTNQAVSKSATAIGSTDQLTTESKEVTDINSKIAH